MDKNKEIPQEREQELKKLYKILLHTNFYINNLS